MLLVSQLMEQGLLSNLSETGYLQLKKDRESILNKIKELESILIHFDFTLESLEGIYNPHVEIYKVNNDFWGRIVLKHPDLIEDKLIEFFICEIKTNSVPATVEILSKQKVREEIKKIFPLYF